MCYVCVARGLSGWLDLLPGLKGGLANVRLRVPEAGLMFRELQHHFNPSANMEPGTINIGCGNEEFADSWGAFERARESGGVVGLCVQSKRRQNRIRLTADLVNAEKRKVEEKLDEDFVFILVGDYVNENVEAEKNEAIYTKENMNTLYGARLATKRRNALQNRKPLQPQPLFAPASSSSPASTSLLGPLFCSPLRR